MAELALRVASSYLQVNYQVYVFLDVAIGLPLSEFRFHLKFESSLV